MKCDRFVKPNRCGYQFLPCGCASSPDLLCILHSFSFEADGDTISYRLKKDEKEEKEKKKGRKMAN